MQSQQQQMAAMAGMNAANMGGPVDGTPLMGNMPRPGVKDQQDPRNLINTYIYDYFIRNNHFRLAQSMIDSDLKMMLQPPGTKQSPGGRNVNGVDAMDSDEKNNLPMPNLPMNQTVENSFLMDWWCQFWDIYSANRNRGNPKSTQYSQHARHLATMAQETRNQRLLMTNNMNPAQYQNMMRGMPNGAADPNNLKRAAMTNRNPNGVNPMTNMAQVKSQMIAAQMQRDGSSMDINGQRPQSPGSNENAPSPNKRPRVDGPMNAGNMAGNQFNEFGQQGQNAQQKTIEGMAAAAGVQGSPMNSQSLDGQDAIFAGNAPPRQAMPAGAAGPPQGNHALQDYQMQLMLLEQQNKKRLLMARQEQDNMTTGPHQPAVGAPGFAPAMSPQGSRAGPSPNPADQMKRGTPKLNQQDLPGSPMPGVQQRSSPAPGMNFDPSQMPPGMPPQFPGYNPMQQATMMRPPSSHPGNFNGQQITPQQMEMMQRNGGMPNGGPWRGGPGGPQGMVQNQGQQMGGPVNNPQQRNNMPPPPAPPAGEQPRTQEPSPSQPAQAPPTPSQTNKANPKKKPTKDAKKPSKAKGANTGATPAASGEEPPPTPTPSTPITPLHKNSFTQNGQQPAQPQAQPQPAAPQQPPSMDGPPFGNLGDDGGFDLGLDTFGSADALDNFDFDSFLHVGEDANAFNLGGDFNFEDGVQAGGDL